MNQQELEALVAEWRQAKETLALVQERQADHKRSCPAHPFRCPSLGAYKEYEVKAAKWEVYNRQIGSDVIAAINSVGEASKPLLDALPHNVWIGLGDGTEVGRAQYRILSQEIDSRGCSGAPADVQEGS